MDQTLPTVAAVSTPIGVGGVGVIRMTGAQSFSIFRRIFSLTLNPFTAPLENNFISHHLYHGWIYDPDSRETVDEVMACWMKSPRSYTGEDVVEISAHGNPILLDTILRIIFKYGGIPAAAGEFTKRAFLNGKLDLTQAEAIKDLIDAKTKIGAREAFINLNGRLRKFSNKIKDNLIDLLARVEATIDFSEDVGDIDRSFIENEIEELINEINISIKLSGGAIKKGINVVIAGDPNVGKSSLLNALIGRDRAIVSEVPGTTRDTIEESFFYNGILFNLIDTAGIRETNDRIEKIGVERTMERIKESEIAILVLDASNEKEVSREFKIDFSPEIVVINKIDISNMDKINKKASFFNKPSVAVSAKTGENIDLLTMKIEEAAKTKISNSFKEGQEIYTNERQFSQFLRVKDNLLRTKLAISSDIMEEDLLSIELRDAIEAIIELSGEKASDLAVERIFSNFCIGK